MSFRKRNVALSSNQSSSVSPISSNATRASLPGVRPSAVDGRPTTSTGISTLDGLLAGHGGLALGTSLLLEESGTTDYAGALLRFFAAEGLMQGHHVHVIGLPEQWGRELPGLSKESDKQDKVEKTNEKMKIAWRYERLGNFDAPSTGRDRVAISSSAQEDSSNDLIPQVFCHTFDLAKRLVYPPASNIDFLAVETNPARSPFDAALSKMTSIIASSSRESVHRILVPSLLSPALYPSHSSLPHYVLGFQRGVRKLLADYPGRVIVIQSLPLSLHPRASGITKWIELLSDGVLELAPFPHSAEADLQTSRDPTTKEEPPQGLLQIHRLPLFNERGSGVAPTELDWTFSLSRRKFTIKPFNLPPLEGDIDAQQSNSGGETKAKKSDLEF